MNPTENNLVELKDVAEATFWVYKLKFVESIKKEGEEWKPHPEYEDYWFSTLGRAVSFNKRRGKLIAPSVAKSGYCLLTVYAMNRRFHRLVAETFYGKCSTDEQVNHKDGNKSNNKLNNLEYVTPKENAQHASKNGLLKDQGESKNNNVKLNKDKVKEIRKKYTEGVRPIVLSKEYQVSVSCIQHILHKRSWRLI